MSKGNIEISINSAKALLDDLNAAETAYKSANMTTNQANVHNRITGLSGMIKKTEADQQESEKNIEAVRGQVNSIFGIK